MGDSSVRRRRGKSTITRDGTYFCGCHQTSTYNRRRASPHKSTVTKTWVFLSSPGPCNTSNSQYCLNQRYEWLQLTTERRRSQKDLPNITTTRDGVRTIPVSGPWCRVRAWPPPQTTFSEGHRSSRHASALLADTKHVRVLDVCPCAPSTMQSPTDTKLLKSTLRKWFP